MHAPGIECLGSETHRPTADLGAGHRPVKFGNRCGMLMAIGKRDTQLEAVLEVVRLRSHALSKLHKFVIRWCAHGLWCA
jgi:hypothetical protein